MTYHHKLLSVVKQYAGAHKAIKINIAEPGADLERWAFAMSNNLPAKEIVMTKPGVAVSTMDAIHGRRSVRAYTPQKLDQATIRTLVAAAVRAMTAFGRKQAVAA